jgi:hypothetical protein
MKLKKEHANKLLNLEDCPVVYIEENEFAEGDALILFNNSENFATIQCNLLNTYRTGRAKPCNFIEFPPRALMNAVFVNKDTVVFAGGI